MQRKAMHPMLRADHSTQILMCARRLEEQRRWRVASPEGRGIGRTPHQTKRMLNDMRNVSHVIGVMHPIAIQ